MLAVFRYSSCVTSLNSSIHCMATHCIHPSASYSWVIHSSEAVISAISDASFIFGFQPSFSSHFGSSRVLVLSIPPSLPPCFLGDGNSGTPSMISIIHLCMPNILGLFFLEKSSPMHAHSRFFYTFWIRNFTNHVANSMQCGDIKYIHVKRLHQTLFSII